MDVTILKGNVIFQSIFRGYVRFQGGGLSFVHVVLDD